MKRACYKDTPRGRLWMHIDLPPDGSARRRPGLVLFFGGGWTGGTIRQFRPQAKYLAERGMVVARAAYRVASRHGVRPDACVEDGKSAVRWLRANAAEFGVDPSRIAAGGGSAGGHVAACAALVRGFESDDEDRSVSSRPDLLVLFNPVMDCMTDWVIERFGGKAAARELSPVHVLDADAPPAVLFFGRKDPYLAGARKYVARAGRLGVEARLWLADGQDHAFFNRSPWRQRTLYLADRFLAEHGYLAGEPTIRPPDGVGMECE